MFSIFTKQHTAFLPDYFPIVTDMHSHILPEIDDGAPDAQTAILLIEGLMKLGITQSIATPHIIGDIYRNNAETINTALLTIRKLLIEKQIDFKINVAAEYMLDAYFLELLQSKVPLLTLKKNMVLTEFSYVEKPINTEQMVYLMITEGYQPVLAHPERYNYFHSDYKQYHYLNDLGFLLQVNILSITGYYGKQVAKAALYIVKNKLASFIGTDLHHKKHLEALSLPANRKILSETFSGKIMNESLFF